MSPLCIGLKYVSLKDVGLKDVSLKDVVVPCPAYCNIAGSTFSKIGLNPRSNICYAGLLGHVGV